MKTLIAVLTLVASLSGFAAQNKMFTVSAADRGVSLVTSGKIAGVSVPRCPPGTRCIAKNLVSVVFTLNGCLDRLGPVTSELIKVEGLNEYKLVMTATQVLTKGSLTARCVAPNLKRVTVSVPRGVDQNNLTLVLTKETLNAPANDEVEETEVTGPVRCTREFRPVCGQPKWSCPPGRVCAAVMPKPKTYSNQCLMRAAGATFLYNGSCKE